MYSQPEDIMEKYALTVEQIGRGRGSYICTTDQGMKMLTPFRGSQERAQFLKVFYEYMNENGFVMEQIVPTSEGELLVEDDSGVRYLLKDMFAGTESSTRNWDEMCAVAGELARYHLASAGCTLEVPEFMRAGREKILSNYEKHVRELIKVKNYVRTRRKKNEFEQKFWQQYPYYIAQAQQAVDFMKDSSPEQGEYLLCHGDFNHHNVLRTDKGYQIIHFEHLEYHYAITDLANYLRKMMEKNNWRVELGEEIISAYDKVRTITDYEYRQLYIMLCFPEKFWKIANHYSNSHKAWLSGRDLEKLDKVIAQEQTKSEFMEKLFSFS